MELTLHKLSERFLITFGAGEFKNFCFKEGEIIGCTLIQKDPEYSETFYKVIAQQDQIDFSALSEKEQKEIGYFDVEKLALKEFMFPEKLFHNMKNSSQNEYLLEEEYGKENTVVYFQCIAFIKSFQKLQEIFSDRRFTLEDIKKCYEEGFYQGSLKDSPVKDFSLYSESQSKPKSWKIDGLWENNKFKITKIWN
jgi:hypothetical protein